MLYQDFAGNCRFCAGCGMIFRHDSVFALENFSSIDWSLLVYGWLSVSKPADLG